MANLKLNSKWETGIYQLETSDPVMGGEDGIDNLQAKQLGNRTEFLKGEIDVIKNQYAPKNNPTLTGIPTAPTAEQNVNNTQIATTAFVKTAIAKPANLTQQGIVQLSSEVNSEDESKAATPKAVKQAYDKAIEAYNRLPANASTSKVGIVKLVDGLTSTSTAEALTANQGRVLDGKISTLQNRSLTAGNGLTGGGNFSTSRTLSLGTPSKITASSTNSVTGNTHTHEIDKASASIAGIVKLNSSTNSNSETEAATPKAVKQAYDKAVEALGKDTGVPLGSIIAFPREITNPTGFLKCDGSTFSSSTYPDLYRAMGNSEVLPNLNGEIGQVCAFATNNKPNGWIWFDDIKSEVTQEKYPELYALLVAQYGSISNVPSMDDRFIRNAGNGLNIGEAQEDEIKKHGHRIFSHWPESTTFHELGYRDANVRINNTHVQTIADSNTSDNGWIEPYGTSPAMTGGDENRPKSIVFKFAIKARQDLIYWIKAYGEISNAGSLDASKLAQELQQKADKSELSELQTQLQTQTSTLISEFSGKNVELTTEVVWQGSASQGTNISLSQRPHGGLLTIDMTASSGHEVTDTRYAVLTFTVFIPPWIEGRTDRENDKWSYITTSLDSEDNPIQINYNSVEKISFSGLSGRIIKQVRLSKWVLK